MAEQTMAPGSVRITPRPNNVAARIDVVQVWSPVHAETVWSGYDVEEARTAARTAVDHAQTVHPEVAEHAKVYDGTRPTCTYGGDCTEPAVFVFTRRDAAHRDDHPGGTMYGCREHAPAAHEHMSRYVGGWGKVTFTVDVIR